MATYITCGSLAAALVCSAGLAQSTATYTGANNGNWNTPTNWNLGVVPVNGPSGTFNAIIPTNTTVQFDINGASAISGLSLQSGSQLKVENGRQLVVTGVSVNAGKIAAAGAGSLFQANSPFASLQANARASASGGAIVRLGGLAYTCTGYNEAILLATGTGSLLDLSALGSISAPYDGGCCSYREQWIHASNGGVIDLTSLVAVQGAAYNGVLRIREETGGQVLLPALLDSKGYVTYEPLSPMFSLPSLQSATSAEFRVAAGNTFKLPVANKLTSCSLVAAAGATLDMPAVASCTSANISITDGGTVLAPNLKIFDYSSVELNPLKTLSVPPFTSVHGASIRLTGGKQYAIAATSYVSSSAPGDILTASGAGTLLDCSTLTELRTPYDGGCCSYRENRIRGASGGIVNLSGVKVLQGGANNSYLRIKAESSGGILLNSLTSSTGYIWFELAGSNMDMPLLKASSSSRFSVGVFDTLTMASLSEVHGALFEIAEGGMVVAPALTTFDNSVIELTPARFFTVPRFTKINNSRIAVKEGRQFGVDATEYLNTGVSGDLFVADGLNSKLDLSRVATFTAQWDGGCCSYREMKVRASNFGVVDLSGLGIVKGAVNNGSTQFAARSGGALVFGNTAFTSGWTNVSAEGIASHLYFQSASFRQPGAIVLTLVANAHFKGNFDFNLKDETFINLGDGKVLMDGAATRSLPQKLEVGCPDLGLPTGGLAPSFQIGQLTIGRNEHATNVLLVDEIDNGNRPVGKQERLYLQGFPSEDGLRILGGSSLYIGDIELYAVIGNQWVRIRDLFAPGQTSIPFDGGRIALGFPVPCNSDLNNDGLVDDADFSVFVVAYDILDCADPAMPAGCPADLNKDGAVDDADFTFFVVAYEELVCP